MTVRGRGTGFQADFKLKGTRYRKTFDTHDAASAWEADSKAKVLRGQPVHGSDDATKRPGNAPQTIQALVVRACDRHWRNVPSSRQSRHNAELFAKFVGPQTPIRDALTADKIEEYIKSLQDRGRASSTWNRHLSAISVLCKVAVDNGWLSERPKGVMWHHHEGQGRTRYLTKEEVALVIHTARDWGYDEQADFYEFLVDTGARLSEAIDLQWPEVSRDGKRVTFGGKLIRRGVLDGTKNGDVRTIPLTARAQALLTRRRADGLTKNAKGPFTSIDPDTNRRLWDKLQVALPFLDDCTPHHIFRHTRLSWFGIDGYDLRRIQEWAGHKSITTTQRYTHLRPVHLETMIAAE